MVPIRSAWPARRFWHGNYASSLGGPLRVETTRGPGQWYSHGLLLKEGVQMHPFGFSGGKLGIEGAARPAQMVCGLDDPKKVAIMCPGHMTVSKNVSE